MVMDIKFLNKTDTYSFLLSAIYAAEVNPEYMLLADLLYALDEKSFKNVITLFEGQTLAIPTIEKITSMLTAMMIYTYCDIDKKPLDIVLRDLGLPYQNTNGPREYQKLKELIKAHKINIGGMFGDFPSSKTQI